jgi:hypothetical protein
VNLELGKLEVPAMRSSLLLVTTVVLASACKRPEPVQVPVRPAPERSSSGGDLAQMAMQHAAAAQEAGDPVKPVAKAKGPTARTVAELWSERTSLKDKSVVVRGQVVKYNPGILGRNWVHLRDGTGTQEGHDNDITVTTADSAQVGQVVTAKGVVHLDRDIGSGYVYPVLIEDAKVAVSKE